MLYDLIKDYERFLKISDEANEDYSNNPEDAEKEKAFDEAYKNEFKAYMRCVDYIVEKSAGKIDFYKAKFLVNTKTDELKSLCLKSNF